MTDYRIVTGRCGGIDVDGQQFGGDVTALSVKREYEPWFPVNSGGPPPPVQTVLVLVLRVMLKPGDRCEVIHDPDSRHKDAICEVIEAERGKPVGIGQFLRERFEEDLLRNWHLPECQRLRPMPAGLRDSPLLAYGFSCDCDLRVWMYQQYTAKLALLERCEHEIEHGPGVVVARQTLALLARAYDRHPQYSPVWNES